MTESPNPRSAALHEDVYAATTRPVTNGADNAGPEPAGESAPGTPRWVKAFGIGVVVLILLFAGLHLTGNTPTHMPASSGPELGLRQAS